MTSVKKSPETIHLKDYRTPPYLVTKFDLNFRLEPTATIVSSQVQFYRNPDRNGAAEPLWLDGNSMQLLEVQIDGRVLSPSDYQLGDEGLSIAEVPEQFCLQVKTQIDRQEIRHLRDFTSRVVTSVLSARRTGFVKSLSTRIVPM